MGTEASTDISAILLVIVAVIPGLLAQRSRNAIAPRSLVKQGASAELGELVVLGIATHALLAYLLAIVGMFVGWISPLRGHDPWYYFRFAFWQLAKGRCHDYPAGCLLLAIAYILVSFFLSYLLGFGYGRWRRKHPLTTWLSNLGLFGGQEPIGEEPILYWVSRQQTVGVKVKPVFVELEMKDGGGFYAGQIAKVAFVKDEEPHKPIFVVQVWFRTSRTTVYRPLVGTGLMVDLADVSSLLVR